MRIKKMVSAGILSVGMVAGLAGFAGASSGTIGTTGPDSTNVVKSETNQRTHVRNNNNLNASNSNNQSAASGHAGSYHNTTAGGAAAGAATNANGLNASVAVDNSMPATASTPAASMGSNTGTISGLTGPDSVNIVKSETNSRVVVENNNNLSVNNTNSQTATSGSATVAGNTTGGSATSGAASNTNSSTITFKVTN